MKCFFSMKIQCSKETADAKKTKKQQQPLPMF